MDIPKARKSLRPLPGQQVGIHNALTLDGNLAARLEEVPVAQSLLNLLSNLDTPRQPMRFHPAGNIDGISPQVITEFLCANHARHHRANVDACADLEGCMVIP